MNYMMPGNSTHSACFRYSTNINAVSLYLIPCEKYFIAIKDKKGLLLCNDICEHCVNWNMISKSTLLHYDPPKEYPDEMQPTSYLRPMEVTFDRLKFAVKTATEN